MSGYGKVEVLKNEVEARVLGSLLTERGIPHVFKSYHDSVYDGIFQTRLGWGHVEAADEHREEVIEILDDLRREADTAADTPSTDL